MPPRWIRNVSDPLGRRCWWISAGGRVVAGPAQTKTEILVLVMLGSLLSRRQVGSLLVWPLTDETSVSRW